MKKKQETVLLVEDEVLLLELLKGLLEDEKYRVIAARDGEEAIALFRSHSDAIDLVITDMGLPKLGGWELFLKLREMKTNVKVILASGFVDAGVREELLKRGAADVLQKPFVPQKMLDRVRKILDE